MGKIYYITCNAFSLINISLVDSGQGSTHVVAYTVMSPSNILTNAANRCTIFFRVLYPRQLHFKFELCTCVFSPIQCTHILKNIFNYNVTTFIVAEA